jgi:TonB-dependent starch-binding outer membrane protein SusC
VFPVAAGKNLSVKFNKLSKIMKKKSDCTSHYPEGLIKLLIIMKITLLFVLLGTLTVSASVYSQSTRFSMNFKDATVRQILDEVEKQSGFKFFYLDEQIDVNRKLDISVSNERVEDILASIFNVNQVKYKVFENNLVVLTPNNINAVQTFKVTGKVVDAITGEALLGVNIIVEGTTLGVVTDSDGNYSLDAPSANASLVFSFIGYTTQTVSIGGRNAIDVKLEPDTKSLEEVVVVGYGVQKKKLTTGANLNVKGDQIESMKTPTVMDALKGITPGVSITQNNGQPGASNKIYIRGQGTTGSSNPLYIVDGVVQGGIDYLSPNDIASIDVLKDAASAAIYGTRGANGVILVTTKQGHRNMKPIITYDGYYGVQNVYKKPDLLNAKEYMLIMDEAVVNAGGSPHDWATIVPDYAKIQSGEWNGTNWFDEMTVKNAPIQSHAVGIQGGSDKIIYSFGASTFDQDGILGKQSDSYYKRKNIRLNTEYSLFSKPAFDVLKLGENITYTKTNSNAIRQGNIYWNDVHNALVSSPLNQVYDENGNYTKVINAWNKDDENPIGIMDYNTKYGENDWNQIVAAFYLEFQPVKNLKLRSSFDYTTSWSTSRSWIPAYDLGGSNDPEKDKVTEGSSSYGKYSQYNTLSYNFSLNNHNFSALIGNSIEKTVKDESLSITNKGSLFEDWEHAYISNAATTSSETTISGKDKKGDAIMSYFGRFEYNFKETYMLSAMMRADGSSRFSEGHRWGYFPSVSAGWVVSNESFLAQTSTWMDFLKIRGSWGQVGNENVSNFAYSSSIAYTDPETSTNTGYWYSYGYGSDKTQRDIGSEPARIPTPDISWETSQQLDFGFDAHFLKSRLQATFDWYKKDTKDWLVNTDIPSSNGKAKQLINGGQVTNKGIEISLNWNDNIGDFRYGATVSLAHNNNEVTDIKNSEKIIHGPSNVLSQGTGEMYRAQVGYPIGYFWGYKTAGVIQNEDEAAAWVAPAGASNAGEKYYDDQQPGDLRWVDQNQDGVIDDKDKVMIGDPNPDYILGLQLNLSYKGVFLSVTSNGSFGQQIAKSYRSFADSYKNNYTTDVFRRWHGEGTSTKYPRLSSSPHRNDQNISDIYIQDGDYLRISNLTVGYDIKQLVKALPVGEMRFYFTAKNLYTFTKYNGMDPEIGSNGGTSDNWAQGIDLGLYPAARTYIFGVSVKF